MNKKVVIAWIIAIVICALIGAFGYVNRDLKNKEKKERETYQPLGSDKTETKMCKLELENGDSTYNFSIKNKEIKQLTITYQTKVEDFDKYEIASNLSSKINAKKIEGLTIVYYGGSADFSIQFIIDESKFRISDIEEFSEDLKALNIKISSDKKYDEYKTTISEFGTYNCE